VGKNSSNIWWKKFNLNSQNCNTQSFKKKKRPCFYCQKPNHHSKECCFHIGDWAKRISKTQANFVVNDIWNCGANNTPSQVINHTSHNVVNEISQLFTLSLMNGQLPLDVWYLNSRAMETGSGSYFTMNLPMQQWCILVMTILKKQLTLETCWSNWITDQRQKFDMYYMYWDCRNFLY
jgi:hypothetical protein